MRVRPAGPALFFYTHQPTGSNRVSFIFCSNINTHALVRKKKKHYFRVIKQETINS